MFYAVGNTQGRAGRCTRRGALRRPLHQWAKANSVSCFRGSSALPADSPAHGGVYVDSRAGKRHTGLRLFMV